MMDDEDREERMQASDQSREGGYTRDLTGQRQ